MLGREAERLTRRPPDADTRRVAAVVRQQEMNTTHLIETALGLAMGLVDAVTRTTITHSRRRPTVRRRSAPLAVLLILAVAQAHGQWNIAHFGTGQLTSPFDVRIGKARNDGTNRVYVSERNGRITEWSYTSGNWSMTVVVPTVVSLALMAIGDVHNDGTNRLYYAEFNKLGDLHEVTWTGTDWARTTIDQNRSSLNIFIGPGRNDGRQRLYVGGMATTSPSNPYVGLWEYTWQAGSWQKLQLHGIAMEGRGAVGNVRNDGVMRVLGNGVGNAPSFFHDFAWNGSAYASFPIDVANYGLAPDPVDVGYTRNDGIVRVVANTQQGKREYTWNGSSWQNATFDPLNRRGDMRVARLKSDGLYRIYATHAGTTTPKPPLTEFGWDAASSRYVGNTVVDAITGATAMIDSGNGRNDGVARLYAPDYAGGEMLEITSTEPLVYAAPRDDLVIVSIEPAANAISLLLSNLTEYCEYRVEVTPNLGQQTWSNAGWFAASAPVAVWSNRLEYGRSFYRVIGRPQRDP